jgi:hypothetical protein
MGRGDVVRTIVVMLGFIFLATSGCAIHYYDSKTGAEHIWGFGHMVMKVSAPREGNRAIMRATEVVGVTIGKGDGQHYLTVGWEKRQRMEIVGENTAIRLEGPRGDFVNIRVGSEWPVAFEDTDSKNEEVNE